MSVDYAEHLPALPDGHDWHLSWMDREQRSSLVIALHAHGEVVRRRTIAVDLYGAVGVRETAEQMLAKWLSVPKDAHWCDDDCPVYCTESGVAQ